jgi:hypothetical protein
MEKIRICVQALPRRFVVFGFALLLLGLQASSVLASVPGLGDRPSGGC